MLELRRGATRSFTTRVSGGFTRTGYYSSSGPGPNQYPPCFSGRMPGYCPVSNVSPWSACLPIPSEIRQTRKQSIATLAQPVPILPLSFLLGSRGKSPWESMVYHGVPWGPVVHPKESVGRPTLSHGMLRILPAKPSGRPVMARDQRQPRKYLGAAQSQRPGPGTA